ncbi:MAG TPA: hypothetical protein VMH81_11000, partial [Bryobacteraceae bacterium]|nr:hypothetical protein [Bryobacteraceae bacterium]
RFGRAIALWVLNGIDLFCFGRRLYRLAKRLRSCGYPTATADAAAIALTNRKILAASSYREAV